MRDGGDWDGREAGDSAGISEGTGAGFSLVYSMDQTPIQAEMPQKASLAKIGAKDARIATGGN